MLYPGIGSTENALRWGFVRKVGADPDRPARRRPSRRPSAVYLDAINLFLYIFCLLGENRGNGS